MQHDHITMRNIILLEIDSEDSIAIIRLERQFSLPSSNSKIPRIFELKSGCKACQNTSRYTDV